MSADLQSFSIEQLGIFVVSVLGSIAICIKAIQKSRCDSIQFGCIKIHRNIQNTEQPLNLAPPLDRLNEV